MSQRPICRACFPSSAPRRRRGPTAPRLAPFEHAVLTSLAFLGQFMQTTTIASRHIRRKPSASRLRSRSNGSRDARTTTRPRSATTLHTVGPPTRRGRHSGRDPQAAETSVSRLVVTSRIQRTLTLIYAQCTLVYLDTQTSCLSWRPASKTYPSHLKK